jgi:hypothetical protein
MPASVLKREQAGTDGAVIVADGEFAFCVPVMIPTLWIDVPAVTLPMTRVAVLTDTRPCAERTLPWIFAP